MGLEWRNAPVRLDQNQISEQISEDYRPGFQNHLENVHEDGK